MSRVKNIVSVTLLVLIAIVLIGSIALYVAGSKSVDMKLPEKGIVPVNVPFIGNGNDSFTAEWRVLGTSTITGVFTSDLPSAVDFTTAPLVNESGYDRFIPGSSVTLTDGSKGFIAHIPNDNPVTYVRIYAQIDGKDYWSEEFEVTQ